MDEQRGVAAVVNEHVGAVGGAPLQGLLRAPPVLLQGLALPGKDGAGVASDGGSGMVLREQRGGEEGEPWALSLMLDA